MSYRANTVMNKVLLVLYLKQKHYYAYYLV